MIDMGSISAAVSSLKSANEILQGFLKLKSISEIQGKVIELQEVILAAQASALTANSEQFSMLEQIRKLEKEITDMEAWNTEKQRYELKAITPGSFAYALKSETQGSEPAHFICASCYENGRKSILQQSAPNNARKSLGIPPMLICSVCKAEILAR